MPNDSERCAARRKDGTACSGRPLPGRSTCLAHSPDLAENRERGNRAGGTHSNRLHRALRRLPPDLRGVYDRLAAALEAVLQGELEPQRASAAASVSRAMISVLDAAEVAERLANIERLLRSDI